MVEAKRGQAGDVFITNVVSAGAELVQRSRRLGKMCCHTFRATGLTNFLAHGGTLENAQAMADYASPRTTQLYDRTGDEVTLDEVERIAI